MAITQKQRDKMPATHFAVPETSQLPINDEVHVKMAWNMVDNTKGLSDAQRALARQRILDRARELGMDTSGWDKALKADNENDNNVDDENQKMEIEQEEHEQREEEALNSRASSAHLVFSALAMEIPDQLASHPNQTPFSGVLTRIDQPSDNPLSGSNGKCVILPKAVAEKALPSLLGMGIDMTPNLDGHDVKYKIGVITEANIVGNEIQIKGFFYGADFPSEIKRIQAEKAKLGFSYECQSLIQSMNDDPLVMKSCVFTGAAILYKDKAAYTTTSLSASKQSSEIIEMNDELKATLAAMQETINNLVVKVEAAAENKNLAAGNIQHMVKPHADALRSCAASMSAAGMGMHPKSGHVAVLNGMADSMESDAVMGKMPHVYQGFDFYSAAADKTTVKDNDDMKAVKDSIAALTSQITDLTKREFAASAAPERKTLDPAILKLLARAGIEGMESGDKKLSADVFKKATSNMSINQRIQLKSELHAAGLLGK